MSSPSLAIGAARPRAHDAFAAPLVVAVVLAYVLPGIVGHDPWKADEAYVFGAVYHMLVTGDWIVPHVAGVPFMEKPPLYYWMAALTARAASPWLPLHDGARLASAIFTFGTVAAVAAASRIAWGRGSEATATLLVLSPLGLFLNAQMMIADLPLLTGTAVALLGFVACDRGLRWGGMAIGAGAGMGFLGKGLIGPGVVALAAIALPLASAQWRTRAYARQLALAGAVAAPLLAIWPVALWLRSPALFYDWFWLNNIGRFVGFSTRALGAETEAGFWVQAFPWFLFPLWAIVLAGAWRERRRFLAHRGVAAGLALALAVFAVLVTAGSARVVYALPMLPPLALACVGVARDMPALLDRILRQAALALAIPVAAIEWTTWYGLATEWQVPWTFLERWFPGDFAMPILPIAVAVALLLTLGFAAIVLRAWEEEGQGLLMWVASLALCWGLAGTLWLPWLDHAKSYRGMFESMATQVPAGIDCVGTERFGESERAIMHYVLGIETVDPDRCDAYVRQGFADDPVRPRPGWHLAWWGARPGDFRERFDLFVRDRPRGQ